jgi:L-methionine (R)-S-oxide reductase
VWPKFGGLEYAARMSNEMSPQRFPVWYDPLSPIGSAVRYVASLSPFFDWVGVYVLKGDTLELGPYLGEPSEHTRIPIGVGVCGTAVATGQDQNIPDVRAISNYLSCSLKTRSELVVLIRDPRSKGILGQIDIDSHTPAAFSEELESQVRKVADELANWWPNQ